MPHREKTTKEVGLKGETSELSALFLQLPAAAFVLQGERFVAFNQMALDLLGREAQDLLQRPFWDAIDPAMQRVLRDRYRAWMQGRPLEFHGVTPIVTGAGDRRWVEVFRRRIEYAGAPAVLVTAFDLTDRWAWLERARRSIDRYDGPPTVDADRLAAREPSGRDAGTRKAPRRGRAATTQSLTRRQAEVLELVARGRSNKQIARDLGITEGTAKLHVFSLMRAYQVPNRTMLAVIAHSPAEGTDD